jgi:flagellar motor switch protein FliM
LADRSQENIIYSKEIKLPPAIGDWTNFRPVRSGGRKIKPVFYGSQRLSKAELDTTLSVHHFFSIDFAKFLKNSLKASTEVHVVRLEQLKYIDFLKSVSGGIIYNKLNLKGIGDVMLLIDYQLANIVINFSLGCQSVETEIKELTELEESIIQSIFGTMLADFAKNWKNLFEKPALEIISYPSIQRETHINLNEVITVVTAEISIANSLPATCTFIYQNNSLKVLNDLLAKKEEKATLNFSVIPQEVQNAIKIPVVAYMGVTNVSPYDLAGLEQEDVISLDQRLNDPIALLIGNTSELKAQPGIKEGRICAKVLSASSKRARISPVIKLGDDGEAMPHKITANAEGSPKADADFELPMEDEEKEEYNDAQDLLGEDQNQSQELGGK